MAQDQVAWRAELDGLIELTKQRVADGSAIEF